MNGLRSGMGRVLRDVEITETDQPTIYICLACHEILLEPFLVKLDGIGPAGGGWEC